ncbi:MAG: hypothetical protein SGI83_04775 [Bacteroidota bacterium]|nr:hypothetical protein [Bacteroidota bacterium]
MKKNIFYVTVCFTAVLFLLTSCEKEKDNAPPAKTKTELLISSPWKFQSASAAGVGDISGVPQLACFVDNTLTFTSPTAGNINEGSVVCSPSTAGAFTWNFTTSETVLVLSGPLIPGGTGTFNIVSLNETNLVVSQSVNFPPPTVITITFKH